MADLENWDLCALSVTGFSPYEIVLKESVLVSDVVSWVIYIFNKPINYSRNSWCGSLHVWSLGYSIHRVPNNWEHAMDIVEQAVLSLRSFSASLVWGLRHEYFLTWGLRWDTSVLCFMNQVHFIPYPFVLWQLHGMAFLCMLNLLWEDLSIFDFLWHLASLLIHVSTLIAQSVESLWTFYCIFNTYLIKINFLVNKS